jgi:hypothetical protein
MDVHVVTLFAPVLKTLTRIGIITTQPGSSHTAGDAMVIGGFLKTDQSLASSGHPNLLVSSMNKLASGYFIPAGLSRI